jgi:diadenylate cyclase
MSYIYSAFEYVTSILKTFWFTDIIDILLVAFLIYKAFQLVRETRALQLVKGIALLIIAYYLSNILNLKTMSFLLYYIMQFGVIALVVVFQPELRNALERLGSTKVGRFNIFNIDSAKEEELKNREAILTVCEAVQTLQKNRIGALILFERGIKLGEVIKTGTMINADISAELLVNLFYPKSPLHDGAVIIRDGRIFSAGCFLPLSQNQEISRELGTRHRAALGISENSDVLVVVVSEETGIISLVEHGVIKRSMTIDTLRIALEKGLLPQKPFGDKKTGFKVFGR